MIIGKPARAPTCKAMILFGSLFYANLQLITYVMERNASKVVNRSVGVQKAGVSGCSVLESSLRGVLTAAARSSLFPVLLLTECDME